MNRKNLCSILCLAGMLWAVTPAVAAPLPVSFDERTDLMSVVWRLMGDRVYGTTAIQPYCRSVDAYFASYKEHPAVVMAAECYHSGIGYDAVMSYGLHLLISADGRLTFDAQLQHEADRSFSRWSQAQQEEFLPLLEDFYRKSHFHQWYVSTEPIRQEAVQAFCQAADSFDLQWFDRFFGPRAQNSEFRVILSLLNGENNYGCSEPMCNGGVRLTPVIGCCRMDSEGKLDYPEEVVLPILVHECCHSYCNALDAKYWKKMKKNAAALFELEKDKLILQAYTGPQIMLDETFVRSCVIRYQLSHGKEAERGRLIGEQRLMGFPLTADIVEQLGNYERQREKYAVMEDFMPVYIRTVNAFSCRDLAKAKAEAARNTATYTCNIADGDSLIPSGRFKLVITFSKPMRPVIALGEGRKNGEFLPLAYSLMESFDWNESMTVQTILLDLEPHTLYSFSILGNYYRTADGYTAGETLNIDFTTGD